MWPKSSGVARVSVNQYRLLGCAFASADLLLEIDPDGKILFAIGAAGRFAKVSASELVGSEWHSLIDEHDHPLVESLLSGLPDGGRQGPVTVETAAAEGRGPRALIFSACKLPQLAPAISCAISLAPATHGMVAATAGPNKLHDAESLGALAKGMWEVARGTGHNVDVCLVEVKGLKEILDQRPEDGQKAMRGIAGALRAGSFGGTSAAQLETERFALLREQGAPVSGLIEQINAAAGRALGMDSPLAVDASAIAFEPLEVQSEQAFRAMRFALNQFISEGLSKKPAATLGDVFQDLVSDTMNRAGAFKAIVESRKFQLAFQPVVTLANGTVHHHEVLARFAEGESPFGLIRLAEELDLIERFDMVMVETVIERLKQRDAAGLQLAVNISGQSIMSPTFVEALTRLLKKSPDCARRLIFEVTESAALTDLPLADRHIQALRKAGFPVCLDDFGAGAASFSYLRMLTVDAVKIDGQYIRELGRSERDADLVRHLVALCRSLNIKTTGEMVETADTVDRLKELGVDYGQGWIFGKPESVPLQAPAPPRPGVFARKRSSAL
jgi:EAL domain-containing protein (putative c-di-GMP-specific phosphodiesterase class I)